MSPFRQVPDLVHNVGTFQTQGRFLVSHQRVTHSATNRDAPFAGPHVVKPAALLTVWWTTPCICILRIAKLWGNVGVGFV